ncbi:MAG: DNA primase [Dysgonamonadaceae bacterium]|jgi:DNA primase|nr:DNA primase [Dysgonamonadaceae bacterium]
MIDQATIERIQDAAQIVDVVSDFISLKRAGANFKGLCPFHDDHTPSFMVSPAKNLCKCFSCGEGGSPVYFIMKHEQMTYPDALKYLAKKYNIEVKERELTDEEKETQNTRESMFILNEFARDYFVKNLRETDEGQSVGLSYFRERGIRADMVQKFQLGYGLEKRDALATEAQKAGFNRDYLLKTGLATGGENNQALVDRFRGRVIFPVHTLSGKVVAFGGRILKKADNLAKYINSPESEIYSKSHELYGIFFAKLAIVKEDRCFWVEGYTDVISMHQAGIENVVASSGTALTQGQIKMIQRFSKNITVLYDGDAAGIKAALRGIDLLLEAGMNVKVVLLPDGEDPDSFARKQNAESFHRFIKEHETDFIRFKTQLLLQETGDDPIKRAGLISNIVQSISIIPDNITRTVYVQDCAALLNIGEAMLTDEVKKIRLRRFEKKWEEDRKQAEENPLPGEEAFPSRQPDSAAAKNPLDKFEREILRYVIRYGMQPLYQHYHEEKRKVDGKIVEEKVLDEEGPLVLDFVKKDLEDDGISFINSLYKRVFDEAYSHADDETFLPSRYFLGNADPDINKLASDLLGDRYTLSKIHAKSIGEAIDSKDSRLAEENLLETLVPRAINELKNAFILQKIKAVKQAINTTRDDEQMELVRQLKELQEIKKVLAKVLGERIVLKF